MTNPASLDQQPEKYVRRVLLRDGNPITLRPIRAEDEPLLVEFHSGLDVRTVQFRYFQPFALEQRTTHERLQQVCFCDQDRDIALVAERDRGVRGPQIIAVGRLTKTHVDDTAELSLLVQDEWQNDGLGGALLDLLMEIAREAGVRRLTGRITGDNTSMRHLAEKAGFTVKFHPAASEWRLLMDL